MIEFAHDPGRWSNKQRITSRFDARCSASYQHRTYAIIEHYEDAAASKAHVESECIKELGEALKNGLLDSPHEVQEIVYSYSQRAGANKCHRVNSSSCAMFPSGD